jgi:hypothetical protein
VELEGRDWKRRRKTITHKTGRGTISVTLAHEPETFREKIYTKERKREKLTRVRFLSKHAHPAFSSPVADNAACHCY